MRIFVDSNYLCTLHNPEDSQHQKAKKIASFLKKKNPELFISNFIFLEAVTVISQRVNRREAILLGRYLLNKEIIKIIHLTPALNGQTWETFQKIKNKNMSFVDASILVLINEEGIDYLLTFDQEHFKNLRKIYHFKIFPSDQDNFLI